jgi:hypothetical protein
MSTAATMLHTGIQDALAGLHSEPLPTLCAKISSAIYCFIFVLHTFFTPEVTCGTGENAAEIFVNQYCYGTSLYTCRRHHDNDTTNKCKEYMYHHPYYYWLRHVYLVASIAMMTCSKLCNERTHRSISIISILLVNVAFVFGLSYILDRNYVFFMWPLFTDGMNHFININKRLFPIRSFCLYTYIGFSGTEINREVWCSMPYNYVTAFYLAITWIWIAFTLILMIIYSIRELVAYVRKLVYAYV